MNLPSKTLAVALLAATPSWFGGSAGAAPPSLQDTGVAAVETVAWRGGFGHGWGGSPGWWGPTAGLAAGAIIGGAVAAAQPWYGYDYDYSYAPGYAYDYSPGYSTYYSPGYSSYGYAPGGADTYCAQRYRSYDPASGTFLGYDGLRHPCP
jgi:hypothetical protein